MIKGVIPIEGVTYSVTPSFFAPFISIGRINFILSIIIGKQNEIERCVGGCVKAFRAAS